MRDEKIKALAAACEAADLPLKADAQNIVFGKGNPAAPILFVGEAPGASEDEQGVPFVGAAGKQLDSLLHSIGLSLDDCYIANILKYRPPNNRDPNVEEIRAHTPYLIQQVECIQPAIIATLGNFSTKFVLSGFSVDGMKDVPGISKLHGEPKTVRADGQQYTVFPLYHPAAMLYRRTLEETMRSDFRKMGEFLVNHLDDVEHIRDALRKQQQDTQSTLF